MNLTQDQGLIEAKTRLTNAKAEQAEIKLALMRKEYVPLSEINKQWSVQAGRVKQRLLALPVRLAGMMANVSMTQPEIEELVRRVVDEALEELADMPMKEPLNE